MNIRFNKSGVATEKAYLQGQLLFMNVVQGIAEVSELSLEELEYTKQMQNQ